MKLATLLDAYDRRARLAPALLALLPVGLIPLALGWYGLAFVWKALIGVSGYGVAALLLVELGRDPGKTKQARLWARWGGAPTTSMLRHKKSKNPYLLRRRHRALETLVGEAMPTPEEEMRDPVGADARYEMATKVLIGIATKEKAPKVFEANCAYGLRRNLWGLKAVGVSVVLAAMVVSGWCLYANPGAPECVVAAVASAGALLLWSGVITDRWVKVAADAYAERLLEILDAVASEAA